MLTPLDYSGEQLRDQRIRGLMEKIIFEHGGEKYDKAYPDGIPTSAILTTKDGKELDSGFVMYPPGHARNTSSDLAGILKEKFRLMGKLGMDPSEVEKLIEKLQRFDQLTAQEILSIYVCPIRYAEKSIDE